MQDCIWKCFKESYYEGPWKAHRQPKENSNATVKSLLQMESVFFFFLVVEGRRKKKGLSSVLLPYQKAIQKQHKKTFCERKSTNYIQNKQAGGKKKKKRKIFHYIHGQKKYLLRGSHLIIKIPDPVLQHVQL